MEMYFYRMHDRKTSTSFITEYFNFVLNLLIISFLFILFIKLSFLTLSLFLTLLHYPFRAHLFSNQSKVSPTIIVTDKYKNI